MSKLQRSTVLSLQDANSCVQILKKLKQDRRAWPEVWRGIITRVSRDPPPKPPMDKLLLGFFSVHEYGRMDAVHSSLQETLGYEKYSDVCSGQLIRLLQEKTPRALHMLSFNGTVESLFDPIEEVSPSGR